MSYINQLRLSLESEMLSVAPQTNEQDLLVKNQSLEEFDCLRDMVNNSVGLESNNEFINQRLDIIASNLGIISCEGTTREKINVIQVALEASGFNPWQALKNSIRDGWASFKGYSYFKGVYGSPLFNNAFSDVFSEITKAEKVLNKGPEITEVLNSKLAKSKMTEGNYAATSFQNGKYFTPVSYYQEALKVIGDLVSKVSKVKANSLEDALKEIKFTSLSKDLPNTNFVIKSGKPGVEFTKGSVGKVPTFNEALGYAKDLGSKLNSFANQMRSIESDIQKVAKDTESNVTASLLAMVGQIGFQVFNRGNMCCGVLTESILQACDTGFKDEAFNKNASKSDKKTKDDYLKYRDHRFHWGWVIFWWLTIPIVGVVMAIINIMDMQNYNKRR